MKNKKPNLLGHKTKLSPQSMYVSLNKANTLDKLLNTLPDGPINHYTMDFLNLLGNHFSYLGIVWIDLWTGKNLFKLN